MAKKTAPKKGTPKAQPSTQPRRLKMPKKPNRQWRKRIKSNQPKLKSAFKIFLESLKVLKTNWKLFGGIVLVYTILTIVLVRGLNGGLNLNSLKETLGDSVGDSGQLGMSLTLFGALLSSSGTATNQVASAYQSIIAVLTSLAIIWTLRQVHAESPKKIGVKDAYYKSTYALIPFLLVLFVIILQLIPLVIGASVYGLVAGNGLIVSVYEQIGWSLLFFALTVWSLYMVSSSIFALYIVTLPDMTPIKALRSAKQLVRYRRWEVLRKIIFLPLALLACAIVIMIPFIMYAAPVAEWLFFGLSMISLAVLHSYAYSLYRELL